jgi:BolA protein
VKLILTIVSEAFNAKPLLARHRLINAILKDELVEMIHALNINAWTPKQYEAKKASAAA